MLGIIYTLATGDFPGYAISGVEEDSLIIILAVQVHSLFF